MRVAADFAKRDDGIHSLYDEGIVAGEAEEGVCMADEDESCEKRGEEHLAAESLLKEG